MNYIVKYAVIEYIEFVCKENACTQIVQIFPLLIKKNKTRLNPTI